MHHIDVQWIIMCEILYAKTLSKTHAKAGQRNAEIKDHFVDDTE